MGVKSVRSLTCGEPRSRNVTGSKRGTILVADGWTVVIQVNSLSSPRTSGGSQCSQCVTAVLMRTNPIRPQDQRSEPNHPRPISEPIILNVSTANVSTDGSTVSARSVEGQASVSTGGSAETARSAEGQASVSTGDDTENATSAEAAAFGAKLNLWLALSFVRIKFHTFFSCRSRNT